MPVTPLSPVFSSSPARTGRRASKAGRSPAAGSSAAVLSTPAQAAGLGPSVYGTAKDITLDEDPFAPASATSARHAAVMSSAGSTPGRRSSSGRSTAFDSDSSTSSSEDEPFPYPHHLRTRQNHTSPYPSGHDSPSSASPAVGSAGIASHRHQASLPQDFVFSSPMSSSSGASSSLTADPDSTLPNGSSPRRPTPAHPPAPAGRALPKRSFARSISQPERSNILDRPPVFNTFVPDLPSYSEASVRASQPPGGIPRAEAPSSSGPEAGSSHRRRPGVRTTSLTMRRAQREAIEEKGALGRTALVTPPAIDSLPPLPPPEDERLGVDEADARSTAMTPVDEQRELLVRSLQSAVRGRMSMSGADSARPHLSNRQIRPLGLLALSQALSAANDEVDSLRATVRETTGLVVDQAYWVAQAAAAVQVQQVGGPLPLRPLPLGRQETCDARTLAEIDELSGSEAREALKVRRKPPPPLPLAFSSRPCIELTLHFAPDPSVDDDEVARGHLPRSDDPRPGPLYLAEPQRGFASSRRRRRRLQRREPEHARGDARRLEADGARRLGAGGRRTDGNGDDGRDGSAVALADVSKQGAGREGWSERDGRANENDLLRHATSWMMIFWTRAERAGWLAGFGLTRKAPLPDGWRRRERRCATPREESTHLTDRGQAKQRGSVGKRGFDTSGRRVGGGGLMGEGKCKGGGGGDVREKGGGQRGGFAGAGEAGKQSDGEQKRA